MNEVQLSFIKHQLLSITTRARDRAEAIEWFTRSKPSIDWTLYLPPVTPGEAKQAYARHIELVKGVGTRVYSKRLWGTIGTINWGTEKDKGQAQLDERLEAFDIKAIAEDLFQYLLAGGIGAVIAIQPQRADSSLDKPTYDNPGVVVLGGHIEPLCDPEDSSKDWALFQFMEKETPRGRRYDANLWDLQTRELYEWRNIESPTQLEPWPQPIPNAAVPRYWVVQRDDTRMPCGEGINGLELFRQHVVHSISLERMRESHSFPLLVIAGRVTSADKLGTTRIIEVAPEGRVERVNSADFEPVTKLRNEVLDQIRQDFSLPGGFLGNDSPSGEALKEANQSYISACQSYAAGISRLLSEVFADYALLAGLEPTPVTVSVNREAYRETMAVMVKQDYDSGFIPIDVAVTAISQFYPDWSAPDVTRFIEERKTVKTPNQLARDFFGGGET